MGAIGYDGEGFKKNHGMEGAPSCPPTMANSETGMYFLFNFAWYSIQLDIFC